MRFRFTFICMTLILALLASTCIGETQQTRNGTVSASIASPGFEVFDDFEHGWDNWTLSGNCWSKTPTSHFTFSQVDGIQGEYYASTMSPKLGNSAKGSAVSRAFVINHSFIRFRIGGGNHPEECCFQLLVNGQVVRTATGNNSPTLTRVYWDVSDLLGYPAELVISDSTEDEQRGYIMVDNIVFSDSTTAARSKPESNSAPATNGTGETLPSDSSVPPDISSNPKLGLWCGPGEALVEGSVDSVDPSQGRITLSIKSAATAEKGEMLFNPPKSASLLVGLSGRLPVMDHNGQALPLEDVTVGASLRVTLSTHSGSNSGLLHIRRLYLMDPFTSDPSIKINTDSPGNSQKGNVVPMIFPVLGHVSWSDTFLAPRDGGRRQHQGQDLMAPKMRPLVAAFNGSISIRRSSGPGGHNILYLFGDNGYSAAYMHINDDTPGTIDGKGSQLYAFAPGLYSGCRVHAGQLVAWVGNSGNAKGGAPHLHFELRGPGDKAFNAAPSLKAAQHISIAKGKLAIEGLHLSSGELRLDGYVSRFDAKEQCLIISVESVTRPNGATHWTTKPEWRRVRFAEGSGVKVVGIEALSLDPVGLEAGTPITVIAPEATGTLKATSCLAQVSGLASADLLASLITLNTSDATLNHSENREEIAKRTQ